MFAIIWRMQTNSKNIIVSALSVVLLVAAVFFVYKDSRGGKTDQFTVSQISTSTELKIDTNKDKSAALAPAIPDLNRLVIAGSVSADLRNQITVQIKETSDILKNNPQFFDGWISLGSLRKIAGDYEGAKEAWEYVSAISPLNHVSFGNLGDLYHYYLKDYPRAEKNLLTAVKNNPNSIVGYRNLYNLYTESYKEKISEAPKVLESGLKSNPENYDLLILLGQYYKEAGDKVKAVEYYKRALAVAEKFGQGAMKSVIETEIQNLTQ